MSEFDTAAEAPVQVEEVGVFDGLPTPEDAHEAPLEGEAWNDEVDHKAVKQTTSDSMLPAGGYNTLPEMSLTRKKYDDGRRVANFFGTIVGCENRTEGRDGKIRFAISPDRRDKEGVEEAKPDIKSRLYAQAVTTYEKVLGSKPATIEDVLTFIRDNPVRLRLMQGDDDNVVLNIGAMRDS